MWVYVLLVVVYRFRTRSLCRNIIGGDLSLSGRRGAVPYNNTNRRTDDCESVRQGLDPAESDRLSPIIFAQTERGGRGKPLPYGIVVHRLHSGRLVGDGASTSRLVRSAEIILTPRNCHPEAASCRCHNRDLYHCKLFY